MARVPSLYVPLDANYLRDPAVRRAGPDAELLYVRGLAHAKSGDTDGVILACDLPVIAVGLRGVPRRVDALVREGLWLPLDDGWAIRSWVKWNMTRTERTNDKEVKRAAAARTNHMRYHGDRIEPTCPHCTDSLERSLDRSVHRSQEKGSQREGKSEGSQREVRGRGKDYGSPSVVSGERSSSSLRDVTRAGGGDW